MIKDKPVVQSTDLVCPYCSCRADKTLANNVTGEITCHKCNETFGYEKDFTVSYFTYSIESKEK